ncbi:MAG: hypothetical protein VZR37_02165 [Bifidobacterium merycicum]|uniref:hypothetical protein n=1 Tax=Bifidobacterium merycicum TaxID=78345 RepID=UPI00068E24A8|nr:hypothetical protein [Bifidobacterium merycicum]MEE3341497.1 hypothetical protein [Bifidobacterium merycicum]
MKTVTDHLELIVLNETREVWKGTWTVERVTLDGVVLASEHFDVTLDGVDHKGLPLGEGSPGSAIAPTSCWSPPYVGMGMVTFLPGEMAAFRIASDKRMDSAAFAAPNVLRAHSENIRRRRVVSLKSCLFQVVRPQATRIHTPAMERPWPNSPKEVGDVCAQVRTDVHRRS